MSPSCPASLPGSEPRRPRLHVQPSRRRQRSDRPGGGFGAALLRSRPAAGIGPERATARAATRQPAPGGRRPASPPPLAGCASPSRIRPGSFPPGAGGRPPRRSANRTRARRTGGQTGSPATRPDTTTRGGRNPAEHSRHRDTAVPAAAVDDDPASETPQIDTSPFAHSSSHPNPGPGARSPGSRSRPPPGLPGRDGGRSRSVGSHHRT